MYKDEIVKSTNECVFFVSKSRCAVLTQKKCVNCKFQKNESDLLDGREKASERIKALPKSKQIGISLKYRLTEV